MFTKDHKDEWEQLLDPESKFHNPPKSDWQLDQVLRIKRHPVGGDDNGGSDESSEQDVPEFLREVLDDCHNINHPKVKQLSLGSQFSDFLNFRMPYN